MNIKKLKKEILEIIFKYLPKDKCLIFFFGSFAKEQLFPSSDIDIGIISDEPIKNSVLVKIKNEIEGVKTLRDIDIVDFLSIPDERFINLALKEVKIWHKTRKSKHYLNNLKKRIKDLRTQ